MSAPTNYRSFVGKLDLTSNLSVHTDVFHVDTQSRKVSIGHTLPQQPLDVLGDIQATNFRGALIGNATTSTNTTGSSTSCNGNALTSSNTSGNATTATELASARDIGGVSFDGSANIDLPGVNTAGNQNTTGNAATSSNCTGNAATASSAAILTNAQEIGGISFNGSDKIDLPGVNLPGNQSTTGGAARAAVLTNAREIGGVSFDGSANIDLPGVNTAGNQNTTGNAATATALANARNIGGISFDGSANINLPGVNTAGNQNTTGNAATATALANARDIGGVSFDGSANIDLPGVNTAGNQNTTGNAATSTNCTGSVASASNCNGNAATATALETSRTIGGVSFDGSGNITPTTFGAATFSDDVYIGTGGKLGLTINDGDGNASLTFNHASRVPDQNGSAGRIDCGVDGTAGYMRLRVKNSVTAGTTVSLSDAFRVEEGFVRAYADLYVDDDVGIGTTSPLGKLHVSGGAGDCVVVIQADTNNSGESDNPTLLFIQDGTYRTSEIGNDTNNGMVYRSYGDQIWYSSSVHSNTSNFALKDNQTERMRIKNNGNVGIGIDSPAQKLDVAGRIRADTMEIDSYIYHVGDTNTYFGFNGNDHFQIVEGGGNRFQVDSNGYIGLADSSPSYRLDVNGDIRATGNVIAYSDRRAKSNIEKIQNSLEKIDKISGYTYTMMVKDKDDELEKEERRFTGLIAQEVLEILPEAVMGSEENHYSLAYGNMAGLFVEAIKELTCKNELLETQLASVLTRLDAIENA